MADEVLKGVVAPKCKLCSLRHWRTQPEKCGLYEKPARHAEPPAPVVRREPPIREAQAPLSGAGETQKTAPGIEKTGGETRASSAKNPSEHTVQKKKNAEKPRIGGRPKKRALAPKAKKTA